MRVTHIVLSDMDTIRIDCEGNIDSVVDDEGDSMSAGDFEQAFTPLHKLGCGEGLLAQLHDGDAALDELLDMVFKRLCRRRQQTRIGDQVERVVDIPAPLVHRHPPPSVADE